MQDQWFFAESGIDPDRRISPATWAILEHSLVPPLCAYGMLPWLFVIVRDPQVRAQLLEPLAGQVASPECSHFVVFARNNTMSEAELMQFVNRAAACHSAHGTHRVYSAAGEGDWCDDLRGITVTEWTERQAYVALRDLQATAALLGLVARPLEGLDPARYDAVLGLTAKGFSAVCACAIGYRLEELAAATSAPVSGAAATTFLDFVTT